jgi:hypothetical protein
MGGIFNPNNLDLYAYAHQNPLKLSDPDGNKVMPPANAPPQVTTWTEIARFAKSTGKFLLAAVRAVVSSSPQVLAGVAVVVLPGKSSDPNAGKTGQTSKGDGNGSIYHRLESPTQTPQDAKKQVESGEIWGKENNTAGGGESPFKSVDAHRGPLPDGARGVEFTTPALESGGHPTKARWIEGSPGVTPVSNPDYVKIPVIITKNTQKN